ncbi:MAG: peptidylprolyl isomerase [Deltaproteobacteria bacterium]|nr:peptidylprolyl isomerase [Deltaproteobacteria bacterium]
MRGFANGCWVLVALVGLAAGGCKKSSAPPERTADEPEGEDVGAAPQPRGRTTAVVDGTVYNILEPTHDASLLEPPKDLSPVRVEFACPGKEEFEPTMPDPQPGFSIEDLRRLFPDLQDEQVPVEINTESGKIECEVWPQVAPQAVAQFLGLATGARPWWHPCRHEWVVGEPYYDGSTFYSVQPAFKIESGCLYRGCEASAGFDAAITEPGAPIDKPGLLVLPRRGPAGTFAILDCAWRVPEPTKMTEGTCEFGAEARALGRDWVAFGVCPHSGIGHAVYRLARLLRDRQADPHAIHWLRPFSPANEYYRYRPDAPAADAGTPAATATPEPAAPATATPEPAAPATATPEPAAPAAPPAGGAPPGPAEPAPAAALASP